VISSKTGSRKRFGFAKTSVGSGATSPPAHDPGARDDVVPSTWRKNSGEFTIHGERIRESPHTFWRVPAGWLVTALLESQSGRRPAGRSPISWEVYQVLRLLRDREIPRLSNLSRPELQPKLYSSLLHVTWLVKVVPAVLPVARPILAWLQELLH
jgi:hypothetical protein